jgi:uncharacterized small protein (DUF1192 family)
MGAGVSLGSNKITQRPGVRRAEQQPMRVHREESAMADPSASSSGRTAGHRLDPAVRERLLALLQEELARASREALARGESPDALAAALDERIARLRSEIAATEDPAPDA